MLNEIIQYSPVTGEIFDNSFFEYHKKNKDSRPFVTNFVTVKEFENVKAELSVSLCSIDQREDVDRRTKGNPSLSNAIRSAKRSKSRLIDLCKSNDFDYFVTLTFGTQDRKDDSATLKYFAKWRKDIRRRFPTMKYLAVPEYHKKGGIHFHILIGGIDLRSLKAVKTSHKTKSGNPIYNVHSWLYGFSTLTKIESKERCATYVAKYITKGDVDPRFFRRRRFYPSQNLKRPKITKFELCPDILLNNIGRYFDLEFYDKTHFYKRYIEKESSFEERKRWLWIEEYEREKMLKELENIKKNRKEKSIVFEQIANNMFENISQDKSKFISFVNYT